MNTCYYCGKEIQNEADLLMKDIDVGFLELEHERKPFHKECWGVRKRKERMRNIKIIALVSIGIAAFFLIPLFISLLH